ncbi:hypothetical protein AB0J48_22655 [Nocardia salmonicida]|uniref:hypothetical protein n=1 Tax=Nocardia salmonicida TaxID=53431 RepID=UPI00344992D3
MSFALNAWGNFFGEVGLDRHSGWLDPALLRGERDFVSEVLTLCDTQELLVDGPGTIFEVDGESVEGRDLVGRDLSGVDWRVEHILVRTDGTREDAVRIMAVVEEEGDYWADEAPQENVVGRGEVVTTWADEHGQWDMALVRLDATA